jgi:hypothetical protein
LVVLKIDQRACISTRDFASAVDACQ